MEPELSEADREHLRRCVELAEQALASGDEPFGSVLVARDETVLAEDRNRIASTGLGRQVRGRPARQRELP